MARVHLLPCLNIRRGQTTLTLAHSNPIPPPFDLRVIVLLSILVTMRYNAEFYPDDSVKAHSLEEWTVRAYGLYESCKRTGDLSDFIKFVLCSEYALRDTSFRAFIDVLQNVSHNEDRALEMLRDYDSLIGISGRILVTTNINIHTVPHPNHALKSTIHLKYPIIIDGEEKLIGFHRIPNFSFATFATRHELFFFFPNLYNPERAKNTKPWKLTDEERSIFYEKGVRPAIALLLGEEAAAEWPTSVANEEFRALRKRGGPAYSTKLIPYYAVPDLADTIRRILLRDPDVSQEVIAWALPFVILHDIKGVKSVSRHQPLAAQSHEALHKFLEENHISNDILDENDHMVGQWYIDVGVEISSTKRECLQWSTSCHHFILQEALDCPHEDAVKLASPGSSKYERDLASHLTEASGFRVEPGVRTQGPYQVKYVQAYTTDKSILYNKDGIHHAKFLTAMEAMGRNHPTPSIEGMHRIYSEAGVSNPSHARLE
ncbi:hypothetical protein H0H93_008466, partial [Arthromyces matolae]